MKIQKVFRKDLGKYRWKIDLTINGERIRRADFPTKQEAVEAIASMLSLARADRYGLVKPSPEIRLRHLYDEAGRDPEIKQRCHALLVFKGFLDLVGKETLLTDLTKTDWKKFVDCCRSRHLQFSTINRYMAAISGILRSTAVHFPELENWQPPKAPWFPESPGRSRVLSVDEISALLAGFRAERQKHEWDRRVRWRHEIFDLFRLMLLTAAREGELLNLRQNAISRDWKTVTIEATKTNTRRVIPLSDTVLEILRPRQTSPVFQPMSKTILYRTLACVGRLAGVAYGEKIDNGWVLYDLRHTAATVLEHAAVPYSVVSAILGHKRSDQTATYTHSDLSTMRRGINSLESWCREIDGFVIRSGQKMESKAIQKTSARA